MTVLIPEPINESVLHSFTSTPLEGTLSLTLLDRKVKPLSIPETYLHTIPQPLSSLKGDVCLPPSFLLVPHETDETTLAYLPIDEDLDLSEFNQVLYFTDLEIILGFVHPTTEQLVYLIQLPYVELQRTKVSRRGFVHQIKLWLPNDFTLKFTVSSSEEDLLSTFVQKLQRIQPFQG